MANAFDQFDQPAAPAANPFDQFDSAPHGPIEVNAPNLSPDVMEQHRIANDEWAKTHPDLSKIATKDDLNTLGRNTLTGIGAGVGGVLGFASPVPGGLAAGALLGGGIGKSAGNMIFGQAPPEAPAVNPAAGQGFGANAAEMMSNIPMSAAKTVNGALGSMSDLSTAAVTPGGGQQVLQGVGQSIKNLGSRDAWVTNPVGNAATLGMIAEPLRLGAKTAIPNIGLEANPELAALSEQHDVPLTVGRLSGNIGIQNLETQLERFPYVGTRSAMEAGSNKIGAAAQNLVDHFTPDNPVDVPDQIQDSMLKTLQQGKSDVTNIQNKITDAVQSGNTEPVTPTNLKTAADSLLTQFPDIFDRLPSTPLKNKLTAISEGADTQTSTSPILDASGNPVTSAKAPELSWNETMLLREQLNDYINRAYKSAGAVGSKEAYQLSELKRGLDQDISDWGENSPNKDIVDLFKERNQVYQDKVAPFKDAIVKKATGNSFDTDLLYNQFIKGDRPQLAQKLMDALDPNGQQLVKYQVLKKALEAGQDTKQGVPFSPARFAQSIERLGATKDIIFPGQEGTLVDGFVKLSRAAERYGQFAENPPTGLRVGDQGMYIGGTAAMITHPILTTGALGMTKLMSTLLTTEWGKSILLKAAKIPDSSPAMQGILTDLQAKLKDNRGLVGKDINVSSLQTQRESAAQKYNQLKDTDPKTAHESLQEMRRLDSEMMQADKAKQASEPTETSYKGEHEAPMRDSGKPLHNLSEVYPDDFYGPHGQQYYGIGDGSDTKAMSIVRGLKGKKFAPVTVYRAVPKDAPGGISKGDWVTIDKQYAKDHGAGALNNNYKIIQKTVQANEIFTNGDSILEWGYDPIKK